jgi:hypothetical protein
MPVSNRQDADHRSEKAPPGSGFSSCLPINKFSIDWDILIPIWILALSSLYSTEKQENYINNTIG